MSAEMYQDQMTAGEGGPTVTRKRLSGKKLVLFILVPLLVLGGGGAGVYFSGILTPKEGEAEKPRAERPVQIVYYDLPDMLVNLRTDGPRPVFLKMSVSLELEHPDDRAAVEKVLPRVIDTFQVYLRELRVDQLQGAAGLLRLREELLTRVNAAVKPGEVKDVLFKEMLVQ